MMIPRFAVVGRVNEGKSSIVAALTEGEDVAIGPEPGTTRAAKAYPLTVDGRTLLEIIDTPGFQQPEAVFAWLEGRAGSAADRPAAVRAFLAEFNGKTTFEDECELLTPIMAGATVIYVVDASHPFRKSYEDEMQILRWTGRPCVALLNQTSESDHTAVWKEALKQYFDRVRYFNAHKNLFEDRIALLSLLSHLVEEDRAPLDAAVAALQTRDEERVARSASIIAHTVAEMLSFTVRETGSVETLTTQRRQQLEERFAGELRRMEARGRDQIEALYSYRKLSAESDPLPRPAFDTDLFAGETWQILGLSRAQLIATSTAAMALAGGVIDAATLGHTFLAGTIIGAGIGLAGGAYAAFKTPQTEFFGLSVAGSSVVVGPHRDRQFPWVVLDRALLHQQAVARRPHSVRTVLRVEAADGKQGLVDKMDALAAAKLLNLFDKLRKSPQERHIIQLKDLIASALQARK